MQSSRAASGNTNLPTLRDSWQQDLLSGFLVFLIALPLCLAISLASGYPAIAGVFTAIIGGVVGACLSNSSLTIKGPAAGLIVIALGAVTEFGQLYGTENAYRMALAVGVAAGVIQILFAIFRTGILGEFFPTSAVHGMLAAIGVIIISKQVPIALGLGNAGEPLHLLAKIPENFVHANPEIAAIGGVSLVILFGFPLLKKWIKNRFFQMVPAQMIVLLVAVPMGLYFDLEHEHTYTFGSGADYKIGPQFLVDVPMNMFAALTTPDFRALTSAVGWKWVVYFALIGTLESMLSAKAIDMIDPWRRKTNLDRDMLAVGIGNTLSAFVGGLPMISEIVRSRANLDNGARTRLSNLFHGLFLLGFVALLPWLIHRIPLAALASMLIYTGFRLASPGEFVHVFKIGKEQFAIFATTAVAVLATDLLEGIAIGIGLKFALHLINGAPISALFKPRVVVDQRDDTSYKVTVHQAAVFSNWILFKRQLDALEDAKFVTLDLSNTRLVDHTVMEKLHELEIEYHESHRELTITGLDDHRPFSSHPLAARKKRRHELAQYS
ncbi:MAG: SulP family inorganic anion transporter [Planctomycetes bacterium]|nr:SulP family inorganic anion transporter [Planctomycetota bacterium]